MAKKFSFILYNRFCTLKWVFSDDDHVGENRAWYGMLFVFTGHVRKQPQYLILVNY